MKKILIGLVATALAVPLFAKGSAPTCTDAPTEVVSFYNFCPEDPISVPAESVLIEWLPPACSGITKYSVQVTVFFDGGPFCGDPAFSETRTFTSPDSTPQIIIPLSDLPAAPWCGPASVRVKALTAPSGSKNRSQNNRFSDPSQEYEIVCEAT